MDDLTVSGIRDRVVAHPYQALFVAAGVGYVLGGGLFSRLTLTVVRLGMRVGTLPVVQRELVRVAEAAMGAR